MTQEIIVDTSALIAFFMKIIVILIYQIVMIWQHGQLSVSTMIKNGVIPNPPYKTYF
jgi:hypothetical protein